MLKFGAKYFEKCRKKHSYPVCTLRPFVTYRNFQFSIVIEIITTRWQSRCFGNTKLGSATFQQVACGHYCRVSSLTNK